MEPIRQLRLLMGLTQRELALRGQTSQPTIAAYEAGRKSPSFATLSRLAAYVGREAAMTYSPLMTREDRRSLWLHGSIAAEFRKKPNEVTSRALKNLKVMQQANPGARELLHEWRRILKGSPEHVIEAMLDPRQHGRDLRQVTPFAGVLSGKKRAEVYRSFRDREAKSA